MNNHQPLKSLIARILVLAITALGLAGISLNSQSANATSSWPVAIPYELRAEQITAHTDSSVTVSKCSTGGSSTAVFFIEQSAENLGIDRSYNLRIYCL